MNKVEEMMKSINQNNLTSPSPLNFEFPKFTPIVGMIKQMKRNEFNLGELFNIIGKPFHNETLDLNNSHKHVEPIKKKELIQRYK